MEEILASILQGEGASSLYDRYIDFLVWDYGEVNDEDF